MILDSINNLSTAFKEDKSLISSTEDPRAALYKEESSAGFESLVYILTWYTSPTYSLEVPCHYQPEDNDSIHQTGKYEHTFLELFVSNYGEGTNNWAVDQIRRWLHLNDKFRILHCTMGELLWKHSRIHLTAKQLNRHIRNAAVFHPSLKGIKRIPNIESFEDSDLRVYSDRQYIDIVLASTFKILDSGRRLTVICVDKPFAEKWYRGQQAGFHYGWVPENSIPGDKIAILPSCTFPVVLRPRPTGGFWIVGDVCAQGFTQSGIGTEFTDNWPEIEIY
jgi:hypothetical protein